MLSVEYPSAKAPAVPGPIRVTALRYGEIGRGLDSGRIWIRITDGAISVHPEYSVSVWLNRQLDEAQCTCIREDIPVRLVIGDGAA